MSQQHMEENPTLTMTQFMESLNVVNMTESVSNKIAENLNNNIDELKERIEAKILLNDQQISLAHSLGQRSMFNSLTQPEDGSVQALSDKDAVMQCLDFWLSQSTQETTT
jgi:ABC-type branched-subunit amino acid transport system ATPase component